MPTKLVKLLSFLKINPNGENMWEIKYTLQKALKRRGLNVKENSDGKFEIDFKGFLVSFNGNITISQSSKRDHYIITLEGSSNWRFPISTKWICSAILTIIVLFFVAPKTALFLMGIGIVLGGFLLLLFCLSFTHIRLLPLHFENAVEAVRNELRWVCN